MANPEHLEILKQGVSVWNEWRKHALHPDLIEAKLSRMNLSGMDLSYANLKYSNCSHTNFSKTNLSYADFSSSNLLGADFSNTDLYEANFSEANLSEANLFCAKLSYTNLSETILKHTDFNNSIISRSIFININFSTAIGLDTIHHEGPSTIGLDTIYKSKGNIPEVFLRGCGLPDEFIDYIPSLTGKGIEYYSCFISYSHMDEEFAKRLHNDLQAKGVRCWFAPHDMKIGDKIRTTIDDSIRLHDKLLLILSEHSVESDWVEYEVEHALDLERERKKTSLFPVRIDEAIMESTTGWAGNVKRQRHIGDFTEWKQHDAYQSAFDRLLRDLKAG